MAAPYIPADKTAQAVMVYNSNTQIVENVLHFLGTAEWTPALLTSLNTQLVTWETTYGAAQRGNSNALTAVISTDMSSQTGPSVSTTANVIGSAAGAAVPNNVTLAVKLSTALRGRSYRGRIYWVGLTTSQLDTTLNDQGVTAAVATAIAAAVTALLPAAGVITANGAQLAVVSRRFNKAPRATAVVTPVTSATLTDRYVDSQRRRLQFHNRHA